MVSAQKPLQPVAVVMLGLVRKAGFVPISYPLTLQLAAVWATAVDAAASKIKRAEVGNMVVFGEVTMLDFDVHFREVRSGGSVS